MLDSSLALLSRGYAWLPDRWRHAQASGPPLVRARLLGRQAVALRGPEAVCFFYDDRHVQRRAALPEPVLSTLFGHGAVHTLDGQAHRVRKEMFLSLLMPAEQVTRLVERVGEAWDTAAASWQRRGPIVLFDEASEILASGVCRWVGLSLSDAEVRPLARDMVAMVDGFATLGPRHWRARRARRRRETTLADLVQRVRAGAVEVSPKSAIAVVASHRDADGAQLDPHTAAVELLNLIRPTVAVCWFITFAAHALHLWPQHRALLRTGDEEYALAFAQETRRFYPFAPFVGGRAVQDLSWRGKPIPEGALMLLDLYGQNHDPQLWQRPYSFDPSRFLGKEAGPNELIPQGGADPRTGHRCPGEAVTIALLQALSIRLAQLDYDVPTQDLRIPLRRMPTRPTSGFIIDGRSSRP